MCIYVYIFMYMSYYLLIYQPYIIGPPRHKCSTSLAASSLRNLLCFTEKEKGCARGAGKMSDAANVLGGSRSLMSSRCCLTCSRYAGWADCMAGWLAIPYPRTNEPVAIPPRRTGGSFVSALINERNNF